MWEHRCKVAVSGVGFSTITRSAEVPLAAHALQAVQAAVEDSGLAMAAIDGLATYAELPASGHAIVDGIAIVSVNCMMAMLKLPQLRWHVQVETVIPAWSRLRFACTTAISLCRGPSRSSWRLARASTRRGRRGRRWGTVACSRGSSGVALPRC